MFLNSYTNQDILINLMQKCDQQEITSIRLSIASHLYCTKHFHKNPLYCGIYADFEADNEIDNSGIGNKTTNNYRRII